MAGVAREMHGDGGRRVLVGSIAPVAGVGNAWIAMMEGEDTFLWQQMVGDFSSGSLANGLGMDAVLMRSGEVIMTGWRRSPLDENNMWVVSMDGSGAIQWQKRMGPGWGDAFNAALEIDDGSILLAGGLGYFVNPWDEYDIYLVKLTGMGELLWAKALDFRQIDVAEDLIRTSDGKIVLAGWTGSEDGGTDAFLMKLDPEADIVWQKVYRLEGSDGLTSVKESLDGGLIAVGFTGMPDFSADEHSGLILKVDVDGEIPGSCGLDEDAGFTTADFPISIADTNAFATATGFTIRDEGLPEAPCRLTAAFSCFGD